MARPEWGIKRTCVSCATRFYDMQRNPIICPSCGATFEPDAVLKSRRGRPTPEPAPAPAAAVAATADADGTDDDDMADLEDDDDNDDSVIEDTGDLAEDDDVIPAVARNADND